jgi:chemotaxis protein histidine kinase CheA
MSVADIRYLLDARGPEEAQDARVAVVVARWADTAGQTGESSAAVAEEDFDGFVAREAEGVADAMDSGISAFSDNPANRELLGTILRRQRALLGSAHVDEIPVLAETLRAVEDLCELIVRLGVPVKSEWLDVFRCARDVLRSSASAIMEGEEPGQSPALSRLRTLHEELVARYGERVASQAVEAARTATPAPAEPAPDPRQRAVVLRATIARALGGATEPREALDELYGLLMSALR